MCGISGIVNLKDRTIERAEVVAMMDAMRHRGPDDEGVYLDDAVGLGFVRLSVIDLSQGGHQPMFSTDRRYAMIYNGEIYNYLELRQELIEADYVFETQTDTEVLLNAYLHWGEEMLDRLNGMWAFVIYDRQSQSLFAARDRYGIKPFYYCIENDRLIFASEIPPILKVRCHKAEVEEKVVLDFLLFNRTDQTNDTFFKGIRRLAHGHKMQIVPNDHGSKKVSIEKWYDLRDNLQEPFEDPTAYRDMLTSSLQLRLRSDVPLGVCLSGGLDSSSITSGLLSQFEMQDLSTFSAIYEREVACDESKFIKQYAGDLKNMYFITPDAHGLKEDISEFVAAHAEPIASTSPYAQFKVMKLASEHVTVTLDGQGADEQLAGYHYFFGYYFKSLLSRAKLGRLSSELYHYFNHHRSALGIKSFLFFLLPASLRSQLRALEKGYIDRDFYERHRDIDGAINGVLYGSGSLQDALLNHFEYKLEHLLKWEDRNSMWYSMEARVPFLDHRLVERTLTLPDEDIIYRGHTKHILREAMKGIMPETIRLRMDKIGFGTPQDEWFRGAIFRDYIEALICSDSFRSRGLMDMEKVKTIYRHHLARKGNYGNEIWKWIHLENWYRKYID